MASDPLVFGSLNLSKTGMAANAQAQAVNRMGKLGLTFSHNWAPIQGAGKEMMPRLVPNKP
jgi:hypothetical protein